MLRGLLLRHDVVRLQRKGKHRKTFILQRIYVCGPGKLLFAEGNHLDYHTVYGICHAGGHLSGIVRTAQGGKMKAVKDRQRRFFPIVIFQRLTKASEVVVRFSVTEQGWEVRKCLVSLLHASSKYPRPKERSFTLKPRCNCQGYPEFRTISALIEGNEHPLQHDICLPVLRMHVPKHLLALDGPRVSCCSSLALTWLSSPTSRPVDIWLSRSHSRKARVLIFPPGVPAGVALSSLSEDLGPVTRNSLKTCFVSDSDRLKPDLPMALAKVE